MGPNPPPAPPPQGPPLLPSLGKDLTSNSSAGGDSSFSYGTTTTTTTTTPTRIAPQDLDVEPAETELLSQLDRRSQGRRATIPTNRRVSFQASDGWDRPSQNPTDEDPVADNDPGDSPPRFGPTDTATPSHARLVEVVRRVRLLKSSSARLTTTTSTEHTHPATGPLPGSVNTGGSHPHHHHHHHRKNQPSLAQAQDLLESIDNKPPAGSENHHSTDSRRGSGSGYHRHHEDNRYLLTNMALPNHRHTDKLYEAAGMTGLGKLEDLSSSAAMDLELLELQGLDSDDTDDDDRLPLTQSQEEDDDDDPNHKKDYGSIAAKIHSKRMSKRQRFPSLRWWRQRVTLFFRRCIRPEVAGKMLLDHILSSYFFLLGVPCLAVAWIFFYYLDNPELDFLPGQVRIAWWLLFTCRQTVTLELARLTQWVLLDCILLGLQHSPRLFGPLVTLIALQAQGWAFNITVWALWDLCLLQGDNPFHTHWLYWTGWGIFTQTNSGSYILNSDAYLRLLLSALLAGAATITKRTLVTIQFGRRSFAEFKPRMEKLLRDVALLSEVASIAFEADALSQRLAETPSKEELSPDKSDVDMAPNRRRGLGDVSWKSVRFGENERESTEGSTELEAPASPTSRSIPVDKPQELPHTNSGSLQIKSLLDRWEEPLTKNDKLQHASVSDVFRFQRALTFMDDSEPFGCDFGPASTRDECILSAHNVFWKLLKMSPSPTGVTFDILCLTLVEEGGKEDPDKRRALRRLFQPDARNELPLLAFIQSCDAVYKKLRYFRASVSNASVIDKVLIDTVDGIFSFLLALLLLSLMKFNPWPVLVSVTSLVVSVSFALGPSVSRYVEGLLLIAVRRPYDLGDRIFVTASELVDNPGAPASWFVEDTNLFTTTLRYARTNEVCTVNNWSIAGSRIVNCNRSPDAIVAFEAKAHISILDGQKLEVLQSRLEKFVENHPRSWQNMLFCRCDNIDSDLEIVSFTMAFRHRSSWQDCGRILLNRSDLIKFVYETLRSMGVHYETPPLRRLLYQGGVLESGQVEDYKKNLLAPKNIRNAHDVFEKGRLKPNYSGHSYDAISLGD